MAIPANPREAEAAALGHTVTAAEQELSLQPPPQTPPGVGAGPSSHEGSTGGSATQAACDRASHPSFPGLFHICETDVGGWHLPPRTTYSAVLTSHLHRTGRWSSCGGLGREEKRRKPTPDASNPRSTSQLRGRLSSGGRWFRASPGSLRGLISTNRWGGGACPSISATVATVKEESGPGLPGHNWRPYLQNN